MLVFLRVIKYAICQARTVYNGVTTGEHIWCYMMKNDDEIIALGERFADELGSAICTIQGAAKVLGVSVVTVRRAVKTGGLRCTRIVPGGAMSFTVYELSRFVVESRR